MFKLNLKIGLRKLLKNKTYTLFNVVGLALGLAGAIIILLYINKETGYDKWDPALARTYMVASDFTKNGSENKGSKILGVFAKAVDQQFPEVEKISIGSLNGRKTSLSYTIQNKKYKEKLSAVEMDSNFLDVYPLKAINGDFNEIYAGKNNIAISRSAANRFFGNEDPINKVVMENRGINEPEAQLVVKAVWDDQKQPSYFAFDVLRAADLGVYGNQMQNYTFSTMLRLRKGADQKALFSRISDAYIIALAKFHSKNSQVQQISKPQALRVLRDQAGITRLKLITEPVSALNLGTFYASTAKQTTIYILISLVSFLLIISCINYTNLTLVMAQARAKEVGVKKVLGAFRWDLVKQFFAETAIQCVFAFLFALIFVELFLPQVNQILDNPLSLFSSPNLLLVLGQISLVILGVMLLSGIYPAFILAGFLPVKVLKGNFSTAKHIGSLRRVLVVFQFAIAIGLVISFLVIYAQLQFMKQKDLGLQPAQLMTLGIASSTYRNLNPERFEPIKKRLLDIQGVSAVSRATEQPINDSGFSDDISFADQMLTVESRYVDPDYFSVIQGKILEGRDFSAQLMATDSVNSIILNETAFNKLGLTASNQQITVMRNDQAVKFNVIGKVKDIQAYGFEQEIVPTVYFTGSYQWHWRRNIILRLEPQQMAQTIQAINKLWLTIEPGKDPYYTFADDTFAKMNSSYETSQKIIFSFGMLTLVISVFGLVGFAAYSAKIKMKEIALRRVLGASISALLQMLNKDFVKLVLLACALADVLAYIYMNKWFSNFVYHIDMPISLFVWTNVCIVAVTIVTVSVQSIKAIQANPVTALKYE